MRKQLRDLLDPSILGVEFKALIEATLLNNHSGKDAAEQIGPLLAGLRKREDLLRQHPNDVEFRYQVVSGYLAVGQTFAGFGAIAERA